MQARDVLSLRADIMEAMKLIGYDRGYFLSPVSADPHFGRIMTSFNLPPLWQAYYKSKGRLADPFPAIALKRQAAFSATELPEGYDFSDEGAGYISRLQEWNMQVGVAAVAYGPGARSGFMYVCPARSNYVPSLDDIEKVRIIVQMSYLRYRELLREEDERRPTLSNRELEVLELIAGGKSNGVIAEILEISAATVDTHVRRIYAKLVVADRTSAVVEAVCRGIISVTGQIPQSVIERQKNSDIA